MRKIAKDLPDFFDGTAPAPKVNQAPAASQEQVSAPRVSRPGEDVSAPTVHRPGNTPTQSAPVSSGGRSATSLPFSKDVQAMQNKLIQVANEITILTPQLFVGSEHYDPSVSKKLGIDPDLLQKLKNVAKTNQNGDNPNAYGDGLWGAKTQEAINRLLQFVIITESCIDGMPNAPDAKVLHSIVESISKYVNPEWHNMKPSEVPVAAKAITEALSNFYQVLPAFSDFLKNAQNSPKLIDDAATKIQDKKNKENPNSPGGPEGKQPVSDDTYPSKTNTQNSGGKDFTQTSYKVDDNGKPITDQQGAKTNPQDQTKQVSDRVVQVLQQAGAPSGQMTLPYDLTSNRISIQRMKQFIIQTDYLMGDPWVLASLQYVVDALKSRANEVSSYLMNWANVAPKAPQGGFVFDGNMDAAKFANTYAGDYPTAIRMLNELVVIFQGINDVLAMLKDSPAIANVIGDDNFTSQIGMGQEYIQRVQGLITNTGVLNHVVASIITS